MACRSHHDCGLSHIVGATCPKPELFFGRHRKPAQMSVTAIMDVPTAFRRQRLVYFCPSAIWVRYGHPDNIAACSVLSPTCEPFVVRTTHRCASTPNQFGAHHQEAEVRIMVDTSLLSQSTSGNAVSSRCIAQITYGQGVPVLRDCESSLQTSGRRQDSAPEN